MKKVYILLFLLAAGFTQVFAQFNWETQLKVKNNLGYEVDSLFIGAKSDATNGLDVALGEVDMPTFEPPQPDIFCYLYLQNGTETLWSTRDYRAVPQEDKFKEVYLLYVNYGAGTSIDISWDKFGPGVDSAYIEDIFDDVYIFKTDMKLNQTVHIENHYSKDHKITIWYNKSNQSVAENSEKNDIFVYPNPAENNIILQNVPLLGDLKIYNEFGTCVSNSKYLGEKLDISGLSTGVYYVIYNERICKFIKI